VSYLDTLETRLQQLNAGGKRDYRIASGGGRMTTTMDRYGADWSMVQRGWDLHVRGQGRGFESARQAVETFRNETAGISDQDLPGFVIVDEGGAAVGRIEDGASVIFFNFRGDRAMEMTRAFEEDDLDSFERKDRPDVMFAGMMQYDGDLMLPSHYLVSPPVIEETLGEYLVHNGAHQLAISETQKFGHVTYFWNGNRSGMFDPAMEHYVEVPSDRVPFDQKPWMKAEEIADGVIQQLRTGRFRHARLNFANGDMVGHTGQLDAAVLAIEAIDLQLGRMLPVIEKLQGALIVTADHGNADEMFERDAKTNSYKLDAHGKRRAKTSHTLNKVPFYVYAPGSRLRIAADVQSPRLSNVAASVLQLMGLRAPDDFDRGLLELG